MSVFHNNALIGSGAGAAAADVGLATRSLRFNSAYLHRTPSSAGNLRTHTFSAWVKRSSFGGRQTLFRTNTSEMHYSFAESAQGNENAFFCYGGAGAVYLVSNPVFRDPSAWFHLCVAWDTTQSTSTDRLKLYINGVRQTSWKTGTFPSQNFEGGLNKANKHGLGANSSGGEPFSGGLADVYFIDGSALSPVDNFIELDSNGVYQAREYSGTFGTNGFHLPFSDATSTTTIAKDNSGNSNNFTASGISVTAGSGNDSLFDSPKNGDQTDTGAGGEVSGNYCTLNPLAISGTLSNGNLEGQCPVGSSQHATFAIPASGKWYFEAEMTNSGILNLGLAAHRPAGHIYQNPNSVLYSTSGVKNVDAVTDQSYGATWTSGDIIGVACDADAGTITFYKNNSSQGALSHQIAGLFPSFGNGGVATNYTVNFGQRAFAYSGPSNHKPLCTALLPTPTVADGSDYFEPKLYTGNGGTNTISGLSFSPDWTWIKRRNSSGSHSIHDTVRGATKRIRSESSDAETTETTALTAFTSDGFTLGVGGTANGNNDSFISWNWDAGSSTVSNTDGSITSSIRASQTSGFSVVSYTGSGSTATVGHGLNAALDFVIIKRRNSTGQFRSWHSALSNTQGIDLNSTSAAFTDDSFNNTIPTSSVFTIKGGVANVNSSGSTYIAYCFSAVASYSAFGEYSGNSSTDGVFVHTGFRPAWLMVRAYSAGGSWSIFDNKRDPFNVMDRFLFAEQNFAEQDADTVDFLSNGFKFRTGGGDHNFSGRDYLYIAFAENPFQANGGLAR
jgi:hypothetical protein